jgi:hypothetical protein
MTSPTDSDQVMPAIRLGWYLAEVRGRNRPHPQPGATDEIPDKGRNDRALPLRIERNDIELRIEVQSVLASLTDQLGVDAVTHEPTASYGIRIDNAARLLWQVRASKSMSALQVAAGRLSAAEKFLDDANHRAQEATRDLTAYERADDGRTGTSARLQMLKAAAEAGQTEQTEAERIATDETREVIGLLQKATAEQRRRAASSKTHADETEKTLTPDDEKAKSIAAQVIAGEQEAATAANDVIGVLLAAVSGSETALLGPARQCTSEALRAVNSAIETIDVKATAVWGDLTEILWKCDAKIQDGLTAKSETQACGYQLGRGLAECYWALEPTSEGRHADSWEFLLGRSRTYELGRLTGRLTAYMQPYTAAAVAASLAIWAVVAKDPSWRGRANDEKTDKLYLQSRRWYELIILSQDPTTLCSPRQLVTNFRALGRAARFFWPQLILSILGLGGVVGLILLLNIHGSGYGPAKTATALLAAAGLSSAGLTGSLKNSAQALLKRLHQDAYTDLIIRSTAKYPKAKGWKQRKAVRGAIGDRSLTPVTAN